MIKTKQGCVEINKDDNIYRHECFCAIKNNEIVKVFQLVHCVGEVSIYCVFMNDGSFTHVVIFDNNNFHFWDTQECKYYDCEICSYNADVEIQL